MNHDFKDFIESHEKVPAILYSETLQLTQLSLKPGKLLVKFYTLNLIGALCTLVICPQYGIGPYGGELGLVNQVMMMGPAACGLFCASVFFLGGSILSWAFMSSTERKWIYRNEYSVFLPYISLLFMVGMILRQFVAGHIHHDVMTFYGSWLVGGIFISFGISKLIEITRPRWRRASP